LKVIKTVFMNTITVVAKNKNTYFIKRLIEEVGERASCFDPWSDFELPEAHRYFARTTGVYGSDLDLLILKSLPIEKVTNSVIALERFRSKMTQYQWFEDNHISCLPWVSIRESDITIEKFFRLYPEALVKPLRGQGGWGIEGLTWEQFKSWKKRKGSDLEYLLQPFVKDAIEYRYFFIKNELPIVLERKAKAGIAANFQKSGEAKLSALPSVFSSEIENLVDKSGASYGAIDLLVKGNHAFVLELNVVPGIEQLEKVSGENVMRKILGQLVG
jgi:glutathione synthase/RimK-type ligase-like ATP-grasp enzyme